MSFQEDVYDSVIASKYNLSSDVFYTSCCGAKDEKRWVETPFVFTILLFSDNYNMEFVYLWLR